MIKLNEPAYESLSYFLIGAVTILATVWLLTR